MRRRPIVVVIDGNFEQLREPLNVGPPMPVTLTGGVITITRSIHIITSVIGSSNLTTILGGEAGDLLILLKTVPQQIMLKKSGGNLLLPTDVKLKKPADNVTLCYTGSNWIQTSFTG